jgi:hypothetical protein
MGPYSNYYHSNKRTCIGSWFNGGSTLLAMACGSSREVATALPYRYQDFWFRIQSERKECWMQDGISLAGLCTYFNQSTTKIAFIDDGQLCRMMNNILLSPQESSYNYSNLNLNGVAYHAHKHSLYLITSLVKCVPSWYQDCCPFALIICTYPACVRKGITSYSAVKVYL